MVFSLCGADDKLFAERFNFCPHLIVKTPRGEAGIGLLFFDFTANF
jgi:hypothetical protein